MSEFNKNILDYVGDDGEFHYPIDEYAEAFYEAGMNYSLTGNDEPFDIRFHHYPFHGNLWQRWLQYREYNALIQALPSYDVRNLGWFAQFTYHLHAPLVKFFGLFMLGVMLLGILVLIFYQTDTEILASQRSEILSPDTTYKSCTASFYNMTELKIYRVTDNEIEIMETRDVQFGVEVEVPYYSDEWAQLSEYSGTPGEGIIVTRDFNNLYCESLLR